MKHNMKHNNYNKLYLSIIYQFNNKYYFIPNQFMNIDFLLSKWINKSPRTLVHGYETQIHPSLEFYTTVKYYAVNQNSIDHL